MILYAPGDVWAWNVAVRYADAGGTLLDDRERWTVRIGKGGDLAVERKFLGTVLDDGALAPSADPQPEILKGRAEPDGTLSLKDAASDPVAARVLRRLLNPDRSLTERLAGTSLVRHAVIREAEAFLPGSGLPASLRVEATLVSARLGGRQRVPLGGTTGSTVGGSVWEATRNLSRLPLASPPRWRGCSGLLPVFGSERKTFRPPPPRFPLALATRAGGC